VARNRKRAKERRSRRPEPVASRRPAREQAPPSPIEHATPDVELAEAQASYGRPEPDQDMVPESENGAQAELELDDVEEAETEPEEDEPVEEPALEHDEPERLRSAAGRSPAGAGVGEIVSRDRRGVAVGDAAEAAPRARPGTRLVHFLQGSWKELQRVQWPDRRQVIQATGVVIGFVIVAGVFLGVADTLAAKLVDYILK
jgi:preprotein translocase SecE subunit